MSPSAISLMINIAPPQLMFRMSHLRKGLSCGPYSSSPFLDTSLGGSNSFLAGKWGRTCPGLVLIPNPGKVICLAPQLQLSSSGYLVGRKQFVSRWQLGSNSPGLYGYT
eukprot:scaffold29298_cov152-Skeletonema_dohrnii-CCMP3373.AAC.12